MQKQNKMDKTQSPNQTKEKNQNSENKTKSNWTKTNPPKNAEIQQHPIATTTTPVSLWSRMVQELFQTHIFSNSPVCMVPPAPDCFTYLHDFPGLIHLDLQSLIKSKSSKRDSYFLLWVKSYWVGLCPHRVCWGRGWSHLPSVK